MVRFRVLGLTDLRDDRGNVLDAVIAQPKRLALLAYLVLARPAGFHRREVLLSLFWPDSDGPTARNSLRQALHYLRHTLGASAIRSRGEHDVGVDPDAIWCDANAFVALLKDAEPEEALALYQGDLMPGTLVGNAPEFNRWLDEEREYLRQRAEEALEETANEADGRGDHPAAIRAWRRYALLDPLNARVALALMRTLANAGDRAAAVHHADVFSRTLHDELGLGGADEVTTFAAELRGDPRAFAAAPMRAPSLDARAYSIAPAQTETLRVVVLPFTVYGDRAYEYLEQGMIDLLSRSLDGAGSLRTVDPYAVIGLTSQRATAGLDPEFGRHVAERFEAELFVLGSVAAANGRLKVSATLYHVGSGVLVTAEAKIRAEGALFEIIEDVTRQLVIGRLAPAERLARLAATMTPSISALKAYLTGESHYRRGRFVPAREELERAVAEDPSFALAWYRLGHAVYWLHDGVRAMDCLERALVSGDRLQAEDRKLLEAFLGSLSGKAGDAERLYREVIAVQPANVEAWLGLGELLLICNPMRGRAASEGRAPLERVLELDPANVPARMFSAYLTAKEGNYGEHRSHVELWDQNSEFSIFPRAMHALTHGTGAEGDAMIDELAHANDAALNEATRYVARLTVNLPGAMRIASLLTGPSRSCAARAHGHTVSAQLSAAAGRLSDARNALANASRFDPAEACLHRGFLAALPFFQVSPSENEALCSLLEGVDPEDERRPVSSPFTVMHEGMHGALRLYVLGHLHARAHATAAALGTATRLETLEVIPGVLPLVADWVRGIRAHAAWSDHKPGCALELLEGAQLETSWAQRIAPSPFLSQDIERYLRAQLLEIVGRDEEALLWYDCATADFVHEIVFLAPSYLRRAGIHERRGDYPAARDFYRRFIELWRNADTAELVVVAEAQRKLTRLGTATPKR